MTRTRQETLEAAMAKALELAALCDRKAELLRDMAEGLAQERWPIDSAWLGAARDIVERMEREAANPLRRKPSEYRVGRCKALSVAWRNGAPRWFLGDGVLAGEPIPRRQALALIAERMKSKLA